jgi:hypothetical protein
MRGDSDEHGHTVCRALSGLRDARVKSSGKACAPDGERHVLTHAKLPYRPLLAQPDQQALAVDSAKGGTRGIPHARRCR